MQSYPHQELSFYGTIEEILGSGSHSVVYLTNKGYALKCVDLFYALCEIYILGRFSQKDQKYQSCCVDIVPDPNNSKIYIVMKAAKTDLHELIYSSESTLNIDKTFFCYQMLKSLEQLHDNGIGHFDIKPENFLIFGDLTVKSGDPSDTTVKLCDYGLSEDLIYDNRMIRGAKYSPLYQSPESIMLGIVDFKGDIWALGLTFCELFSDGKDEYSLPIMLIKHSDDILNGILETFGPINTIDWPEVIDSPRWNSELSNVPLRRGVNHINRSGIPKDMIALLERMLQYNPNARPTVKQILKDPMFNKYLAGSECSKFQRLNYPKWNFNTPDSPGKQIFKDYLQLRQHNFLQILSVSKTLDISNFRIGHIYTLYDAYHMKAIAKYGKKIINSDNTLLATAALIYIVCACIYDGGTISIIDLGKLSNLFSDKFCPKVIEKMVYHILDMIDYRLHQTSVFNLIGKQSRRRINMGLILSLTSAPLQLSCDDTYRMLLSIFDDEAYSEYKPYSTLLKNYETELVNLFNLQVPIELVRLTDEYHDFFKEHINLK